MIGKQINKRKILDSNCLTVEELKPTTTTTITYDHCLTPVDHQIRHNHPLDRQQLTTDHHLYHFCPKMVLVTVDYL